MAVFTGKTSLTKTDFVLTDDDVDETAIDDVFGGSATIYTMFMEVPSGTTYLKLYDNADPTVGTTAPDCIFKLTEAVSWTIIEGLEFTNFSYAAVQEDGTSGTTGPGVTVKLHVVVR
tara:strand:+ start:741 stop:1091 length:351 start_codon:yes stop_codon:yes gene_type:complete